MSIEFANQKDKLQVIDLWHYCFDDDESFVKYYFEEKYALDYNLVSKDNGEVVSSLMLNPYKLSVNNTVTDASYIVGVSTLANRRGEGRVTKLIKYALKHEINLGRVFSLLMAIDSKIYTRYGFTNIFDMFSVALPFDRIDVKSPKNVRIIRAKIENFEELADFYNSVMSDKFSYIKRDKKYFTQRNKELELDNLAIYLAYIEDRLEGYMIFSPRFGNGKNAFVKEIYANSAEVYDAFFAMIKSHYTQTNSVVLHDMSNGFLKNYLVSDNKVSYKLEPFMMVRILDVQKAIEILDIDEDVTIEIKDSIIEENNKTFSLSKKSLNNENADMTLDISDFTLLYFGQIEIKDLLKLRNININKNKLKVLEKIFQRKENFFNDYV
ncbi:MAG: GNAT family N-acetyltransferase [Peptostreptococcaceae bacterium]|nr:GNAT family N-acetyltransferase [Peptostreptococcaceae bacterium]